MTTARLLPIILGLALVAPRLARAEIEVRADATLDITVDVEGGLDVGGGGGVGVGGGVGGGVDVGVGGMGGGVVTGGVVGGVTSGGVVTGGVVTGGGVAVDSGVVLGGGGSGDSIFGEGFDPLVAPHWELSIGMLLPMELSGDGPTLAVAAGRQIGPVRLAVDYSRYVRASEVYVCPYEASRLGLSARYRVSLGFDVGAIGAYVEGGLGREVARHEMATEIAPSVLVGVGLEGLFGDRGSIGFDLGYRMHIDTATDDTVSLIQFGLLLGRR